jgi:hypothetical protein
MSCLDQDSIDHIHITDSTRLARCDTTCTCITGSVALNSVYLMYGEPGDEADDGIGKTVEDKNGDHTSMEEILRSTTNLLC